MDDDPISGLHFQIKETSRKKSHSSSSTLLFPTLSPELCRNRQEPSSLLPHFLWNLWECPWRQLLRSNTFTFLHSLKTFPRAEVLKCLCSKLISPNPVAQYTLWVILLLLDNNLSTSGHFTIPHSSRWPQVSHLFWQGTHGRVTLLLCFPHRKMWLTAFAWFLTFHTQQNFTIQLCHKMIYHILYVKGTAQGLLFSNSNMSYIPVWEESYVWPGSCVSNSFALIFSTAGSLPCASCKWRYTQDPSGLILI